MRRALFAPLLVLSACVKPPTVHEGQVNPMPSEVQRVQTRMLDAMGGKSGWEKARYFEFDFGGIRNGQPAGTARRHHWDRFTGDYSLRFAQGTDTAYVVTNVNVAPLKGRAWINGREITGPRVDTLLTSAYARFINDSYWLLMPYKWSDPGVHTHYVGKQTDDKGVEWEVVKLTFDQVGLTPQNEYLAYINPRTGLMERWYHFPRAGAQPAIYDWKNWQQFGPIRLATEKPTLDGASMIRFDNVRVETKVPKNAFAPPSN